MNYTTPFAILLVALCILSTGAQGQNVYRCGNTYSQKPCADAVVVDVGDPRSPAQKAQADAETRRESAAANAMEKARLKEEAQLRSNRAKLAAPQTKKTAAPARTAASAAAPDGAAKKQAPKSHSKKKKEPEYFTARSAASKPKAPASDSR